MMLPANSTFNLSQISLKKVLVWGDSFKKRQQLLHIALFRKSHFGGQGFAKEVGNIFRAVSRHLEQRLEKPVEQQILTPNVEDNGQAGAGFGDISKVLFRSHAQINAIPHPQIPQSSQDLEIRRFIGN